MGPSSFIRASQYKSSFRVLAGIFLRSRETQTQRARDKQDEIEKLRRINQQQQQDIAKVHKQLVEQKRQIARLQVENW